MATAKKINNTIELKKKVERIVEALSLEYPEAKCALDYKTPEQLLFATILSAQCTDVQVNKVTKVLFAKYPTPELLAKARLSTIESIVHSTGFFKNKAKNLQKCARVLVSSHGGRVPQTMEALTALAGVGRKTANVVLGNAFGVPGLVVDTHVKRIANLLGLTQEVDPVKIEGALEKIIPQKQWTMFSHWIIYHGRQICVARRPACSDCVVKSYCDYGRKVVVV